MADITPPPSPELADLVSVLGPKDTRELVRTFLKDSPLLIAEVSTPSASAETPSPAQLAAHSLKSTARLVGARALSTQAAVLELRFMSAGTPTPAELAALQTEFENVRAIFGPFAGL